MRAPPPPPRIVGSGSGVGRGSGKDDRAIPGQRGEANRGCLWGRRCPAQSSAYQLCLHPHQAVFAMDNTRGQPLDSTRQAQGAEAGCAGMGRFVGWMYSTLPNQEDQDQGDNCHVDLWQQTLSVYHGRPVGGLNCVHCVQLRQLCCIPHSGPVEPCELYLISSGRSDSSERCSWTCCAACCSARPMMSAG